MKKILLTLAVGAVAVSAAFAQGTIAVYSTSATFSMYTNNATYSSAKNGVYDITGGKTATTANGFYYALLYQSYNAGLTAMNPLDSNYALGLMATNFTLAGSIRAAGSGSGAAVTGWAAPTDGTYATSGRENFLLVGWSASLGTTWSAVSSQLQSGNWSANGFFGVSALGNSYAGGGPLSLGAVNIFGASGGGSNGGLTGGVTLYAVPTPEPTTLALGALGSAAMLLIRRRK